MSGLGRSSELLLVDDGSTDGTYERLLELGIAILAPINNASAATTAVTLRRLRFALIVVAIIASGSGSYDFGEVVFGLAGVNFGIGVLNINVALGGRDAGIVIVFGLVALDVDAPRHGGIEQILLCKQGANEKQQGATKRWK